MEDITILVVDDEKEIRDLIGIYASNEGYRVIKAADGREALEILEREEVHLLVLDIMMPNMDGIQACLKIRERKHMPIIMLSAKSQDMDKIYGLSMGADDYMIKPFNPLELMARIKSQLRRGVKPGEIGVWLKREGQRIELTVTNKGEDIPPEQLARIFERFYRVEGSRSLKTGGAGLGLAIVKSIVELHGGAIRAESQEGVISFHIWLPSP